MAGCIAPISDLGAQFFTNQGIILAGGKIQVYLAGSTTATDTWTDSSLAVKNANPIVLNSAGRLPNPVWLQSGLAYKFVLQDSTGASVGITFDNISGINDPATLSTQWTTVAATPTYISTTSFSMLGDQTNTLQVGRRVQATVTAGVVYSTVATSSYSSGTGITTVTVSNDSTGLDSGLSLVNVGVLPALNSPVPITAALTTALQRQTYTAFTTGGTATAFTLTPTPAIVANTAGTEFEVTFNQAPGATPTLAVSGLAALPLKYKDLTGALQAITATQVPSGWTSKVYTDGTNWIILTPTVTGVVDASITASKLSGAQTGSAPIYGCRAWATWNGGTAGTNAPTSGGNVTSITRHSTGEYTITFSTAMPDAAYALIGSCRAVSTDVYDGFSVEINGTVAPLAGSVRISTFSARAAALADPLLVSVAIFR